MTLVVGVFFLGLFLTSRPAIQRLISPIPNHTKVAQKEVFGFAPYWTLSKLDNIDWNTLTTFAYFSLPVGADGTIDKTSYEWTNFQGKKLSDLFAKAQDHKVKRVVTLTQMNKADVETFLDNPAAWDKIAQESADILNGKHLDGVNIDFEYVPSNDKLKGQFTNFVDSYSKQLRAKTQDPYITVSVLASSVRFNKIYDIGKLSKITDGIFMMAYDFYYPGSESAGPSAPLYGYNGGKGPYWYDVSTAVDDFLKVADSSKIIMGVPYYGWNYPTSSPTPNAEKVGLRAAAVTNAKADDNKLLSVTPVGGWDEAAQVSWRSYWEDGQWHVVYMEDEKSLSLKYQFARSRNLGGVGIWALGFDSNISNFWPVLSANFGGNGLAMNPN